MKCSNCGADIPPDSVFCRECGAKVEIHKILFCRECGAKLPENSNFCSECGAKTKIDFPTEENYFSKQGNNIEPEYNLFNSSENKSVSVKKLIYKGANKCLDKLSDVINSVNEKLK